MDTGDSGNESYLTRTTAIVTSRELFQYPDVHSYPLAHLSNISSIDLLASCLMFVASREQLKLIAELIEGVPLALLIAADLINLENKSIEMQSPN